jgi:uncharacterized SAM-dependent methyltransferase
VAALGASYDFEAGELIHTEISQKYDDALIQRLAVESGFRVAAAFTDQRGWFTDQLWEPV